MADSPQPDLSVEQLKLLVSGLREHAICSLDAQGLIQTWNEGARALSGYASEDVLGRPYATLFESEDAPAGILARARSGRALAEGWRLRKNGSRYWGSGEITPVKDPDGRLRGFVEICCESSDRKDRADGVARSEEAFRLLVEGIHDYAIYMLDRRGNVASWNSGARRIKGYTAEEIVGQSYARFFTPEDVAAGKPQANLEQASIRGDFEEEGWRVRKDGSRFWASVTLTALRDEKGRLRGFAKVTRDISQRRRSEELLRQSEERYRQLIDGIQDYAIYMLSPEGVITSWNPGAERVEGYHADEVIGRNVSLFYAQKDVEAGLPREELRQAAERGRVATEGWRVRRDGSIFQAATTTTAIRGPGGAPRGFVQISQDLTPRLRAEEELRRADEKFRLLVDGVREVAIFLLHPDGRVASWNPGAERLKGYRADEIVGRPHAIFYPPEDQDAGKPRRLLDLALSEGQARDEGWRVRKDGGRFWADVLITALYDSGGLLRGFSKVTRDLTERRKREEEVRRLNGELMERVRDLDAFASTVAHDVSSPLRAITNYAELTMEESGPALSEENRQDLRRVIGAARHMRRLVDDLLAYSRLTRAEIRPEAVDSGALIEDLLMEMAHALGESKAQVRLVKPLPLVVANATLLRQALTNLLSNAIKFARPGVPPSISVKAERGDGVVRLFVEDNGIGVAPEDVKRLFQPFERLGAARTYPGSGLGLAIVRRAVEKMGGRAGMEPVPSGGARFWIELPAA
jgi:PAS domain S-box-containing protein